MLEVKDLDIFYGDRQVLWSVSLEVKERQLVALIGSNGSGKTTLLRAISGVIKPRSGSIHFLGKRIDTLQPYEIPRLGLVQIPEGRRLFPLMTVAENLEVGAYLPEARKKKEDSLNEIFEFFPILKERLNQRASSLSGGEQQMLAIARGLMIRPKLILLDEPSIGLAPKLVEKVFVILNLMRDRGATMLLVEQNVRQAVKIADYGYVLENGRITLHGEGHKLLSDDRVRKAYIGM